MVERFFLDDLVGKTIKLSTTDPPSEWIIDAKLSDKNSQWSAEEYRNSQATEGPSMHQAIERTRVSFDEQHPYQGPSGKHTASSVCSSPRHERRAPGR
ncbi:hypothetical protein BJX65DRAFT_315066 [Aspergillus insuetus]